MYRGSGKLLERDYKVHIGAVEIIKNFYSLRCDQDFEVSKTDLNPILTLINELSNYYKKQHNVTPTETLISKIILGTLGCLPAFDRFFIDGVKINGSRFTTLKEKSLRGLFDFREEKESELKQLRKANPQYSVMKLIDMYFWQIGFDNQNLKKLINGKTKLL